jgi:hypothetical protein
VLNENGGTLPMPPPGGDPLSGVLALAAAAAAA